MTAPSDQFPEFSDFKNDFDSTTRVLALISFAKYGKEILSKYFTICEITALENRNEFEGLLQSQNYDFAIIPVEIKETVGLTIYPLIDLFNRVYISVIRNIGIVYICYKTKDGEFDFESFYLDGQTDLISLLEYLIDLDCETTEKLIILSKNKNAPGVYVNQDNYVTEYFCEVLLKELLT
jgi:hypothetical protein